MRQAPSHRLLVAAALLLAGLAAYEGITLAAARPESAFAFPGDVAVVGDLAPAAAELRAEDAAVVAVTIAITPRARLRLPAELPACRVFVGDGEVTDATTSWVAGSATWSLGEVPQSGDQQLLAVEVAGRRTLRLVTLRDPSPLIVRLGGDASVGGTIVDSDGHAVRGARVWLGGETVVSDDEGRFSAHVMAGTGLPVVVRAPGFASAALVLDVTGGLVDSVRFVLREAAEVRVRLLGPMPAGGSARVFVLPGGDPTTSDEAQYPYFMQALEGGVPMSARGVAVLSDLPVDARVRVAVEHAGLASGTAPTAITRTRALDLTVAAVATPKLSGRIRMEDGAACVGALVVSASGALDAGARPPAASLALPPLAYWLPSGAVHTAADGSFALARRHGTEPGVLLVGAEGHVVLEMAVRADARDLEIELPLPCAAQTTLPRAARTTAPRLELQAPEGRYDVRIAEVGRAPRPVVRWQGGASFFIPMRERVLADVSIQIEDRDGVRMIQRPGVAVLADVPLVLSR